jgi:hypothetical protein
MRENLGGTCVFRQVAGRAAMRDNSRFHWRNNIN